ncbi:hypothetical protein ACKWTF_006493 [Chironomus riparius]
MMALRNIKAKWKWPTSLMIRKVVLYRILVIGIIVLSSLYLIDYTSNHLDDISHYTKIPRLFSSKEEDYNDVEEVIDENYFVKTSGCRIVKMDVMSDQIKSFFPSDKPKHIKCGVPPLTASDEKYLWINVTEAELKKFYNVSSDQLQCYYAPFTRLTDYLVVKNETLNSLHFGQRTKIDSEYIQVFCENHNQTQIYTDYHSFFPAKFDDETDDDENNSQAKQANPDKYNIMILGIDSVSKLNFHRMMNKTLTTVVEELDGIELHGYNKIDDNTYPNLIPLLSGLSSDELASACLSSNASAYYFDNCHFVWNDFKNKGYSTLFAEDSAALSLFNYFKSGFDKQPVDYYFRTILYQMEKEIAHNKVGNYKLCLGQRTPFNVFMDGYLRKFIKSMSNELFFSFFWTSSMTHDYINYPMLIDDDLSKLLTFMKDEQYLDKTILLMLSDHGMRFGSFRQTTFQGMVEERLPFLFAIFPKSFKMKYRLAVRNFKRNSRRLTTHYDVYETLKDLIHLDEDSLANEKIRKRSEELMERGGITLPRGISLFLEVPEQRTCDSAGIESHWCTCYEKLELSSSDHRVQRAARFVVKTINDIVKPHKACHFLYLNSIVSAHMHVLNDNVFKAPNEDKKGARTLKPPKGRKKIYDITLKITTKPGPRSE